LSPGKTPRNNLQFLTFFINTIKAVADHSDLLRACIASEGNDYRLGANEAPPAIISVFTGAYLKKVLDEIEQRVDSNYGEDDENGLKLDIHRMIPDVMRDNTDRNRTSPFAFTGNKFEFRAVGSSANCADPMTVMNTIMASQLRKFKKSVDASIKKGEKKDTAILKELSEYIRTSKKILFEGDNYGEAWAKEAEKRGLSNIKSTPRALDAYVTKKSVTMFEKTGVMTKKEMEARHDIRLENYILKVEIESRTIEELAMNQILPAAIKYQTDLFSNLSKAKNAGLPASATSIQKVLAKEVSGHIEGIYSGLEAMRKARSAAEKIDDSRNKAITFCEKVKPFFEDIRSHVDSLELVVEDDYWPLPKYRELLFTR
jgi:glutamine synthetase